MEDWALSLDALQQAIGYSFREPKLLMTALTHSSFVKGDGANADHNERLEFLGDAVLELSVSERLYQEYPEMDEGAMTRLRARLVCESALFLAAQPIGLAACLRLGHGEERSGGRDKPSVVSDALEALIGAIYLDGGQQAARAFVEAHVVERLELSSVASQDKDYKTRLQEHVQKQHLGRLRYELVGADGPEHHKAFTMRVLLNDQEIGSGEGGTKQRAGQQAAQRALQQMLAPQDGGGTAPCD